MAARPPAGDEPAEAAGETLMECVAWGVVGEADRGKRARRSLPPALPSRSDAATAAELDAFRREYEDERTWEALREDASGRLLRLVGGGVRGGVAAAASPRARPTRPPPPPSPQDAATAQRAARAAAASTAASAAARVRRGVIRALVVCLDLSSAAASPDVRPTRAAAAAAAVATLARSFFDLNQLSQLSVQVTRRGGAEKITGLGGAPEAHVAALAASLECAGAASLQNALDLALATLKPVPPYALREVVVFFCGLTTADPGDIGASIAACKAARVRVSIIGLAAEVHVCRRIADETGGTHAVARGAAHLAALARAHGPAPPVRAADAAPSLVRMGFPRRVADGPAGAAFVGEDAKLSTGGYSCPRCAARVAELPAACHVCGLTLVSSPHLARSYHHLFPVPPFAEDGGPGGRGASATAHPRTPAEAALAGDRCCGCLVRLGEGEEGGGGRGASAAPPALAPLRVACPSCLSAFCFDCDAFIHTHLHVCPGCEAGGGGRAAAAPWAGAG